jgi:hypothetical protein
MLLLYVLRHATRFGIGLTVFIAFLLSGCGGGGGDSGGGGTNNPLSVYIDATTPTVQTGSVDLRGVAYCDNCPPTVLGCSAIQGPLSSAIDITWKNRTTGATGSTLHGIFGSCSCTLIFPCFTSYSHQWMAYGIPLDIGEDVIEVKASDMSGASAIDTVTLTRIPASPVALVALAGKGEVTLNWNSVAGATSYNLYWSTSANMATATKIPGVASPFVHDSLTDGITYYYFVTAVIGNSESLPSPTVFATPGWHTEVLAPTTATTDQRDTSIATDSAGYAHIHYAYNECTQSAQTSTGLWYCASYNYHNDYITDATGSWTGESIGPSPYVDANIAVDSGDTVHVGYAGSQGIIHAVYVNGAWAAETIDAGGWCDSALALDATDKAHLAYYASSTSAGELRYATKVSGAWVHGVADTFPQDVGCNVQPGAPLSLAVDATGIAHIAYPGRYPDYGLKYATNQGGAWVTSTVDTGYIPNLSAAVDANGKTHVAYSDSAHNIKYAHQDASGAWFIEVIESNSGVYPSLALDASGNVHVSYISSLNGGQLIYATNSTGAWHITPIDGADFADTALALDTLGKVHISYFSGGNLKYATNE